MNKNLQSPTKLTEFAPLQPEEKQQGVSQFISKFFKLNRHSTPDQTGETQENNGESTSQDSLPSWAIDTSENETSQDGVYAVDITEPRSLPNVLKRISNLLALKSNNLQAYSDSELKQYWMPDSVSKECYDCCEKFTTFRRRHHCRICGQIFCSQCCNQQIPGKIFGCTGDLRVCTYCCKIVLSDLQSPDIGSDLTADLRILQENLQSKYGLQSLSQASLSQNSLSPVASSADLDAGNTLKRKISVGYQEEKFAPGRTSNVNYLTTEEKCRALQNSASLRNLFEEICKPITGIVLRTHRYRLRIYSGCFLGSELVDWLIYQQKASTRIQAAAICQALLDGGYMECVADPFSFVDGYALYKPGVVSSPEPIITVFENPSQDEPSWVQFVPQDSSTTDSETEQFSLPFTCTQGRITSSSSYTLDLNVEANTVYLSKPPPSSQSLNSPDDSNTTKRKFCAETPVVRTSEQREFVPESGWHKPSHLRKENCENMAYNLLTSAFKQHEETLLKQLLSVKGLSLSWSDILIPLTHDIVDVIRPDVNHNAEDLDIRQYVKFKKLPGMDRSECKLIRGIVCSKNVVHKGMSTKFDNPKILLLEGSIVYQRIEGRLMSLEPVLMQEHAYLSHVAARIIALQPDIVLVQRNVSRLAQDLLREQGVTLILNVKQRILERIAKCTQADLVTSVDAHIGRPRLGMCKRFFLKSFKNEYGDNKTLMFFEGLPSPHLGGTVLLTGKSQVDLIKLKKVASLFLFACYNWRLEKSFLMDEFAQPPSSREFFDDSKENSPVLQKPNTQLIKNDELMKLKKTSKNDNSNMFEDDDTEFFNTNCVVELKPKSELVVSEERKISSEVVKDYSDPLHLYNKEDDVVQRKLPEKLSVADLPFSNHFRKALDDTILCISPYLVFSVPYLETENGRKCKLRSFFPTQIFYSEQFTNIKKKSKDLENKNDVDRKPQTNEMKPHHPFITTKIRTTIDNNEIQALLAHYRACGGRLQKQSNLSIVKNTSDVDVKQKLKSLELDKLDVLDPNNHQRLAVLFCSFSQESHNAPAFCVNPWVVYMSFYGRNDIPLGCFLERYCFRSTYSCQSKTCDTPMLKHIRRFVHNSGCVSLSLNSLENECAEDNIVMWSACSKCQICSPVVPMSGDTWSFSFAKYLELRFHGGLYLQRGSSSCPHSLHHDYCQHFGFKNVVASFKYTHVQLWEVSLPPAIIEILYDETKQLNEMIEEIRIMALKGHEIFSTVSEKLSILPVDFDGLNNLKQILNKEQIGFKQRIEEVQLKLTSPSLENRDENFSDHSKEIPISAWRIADALVRIKRLIVESVEQWNMRLSESQRKRDSDKKKDRLSHTDSDSPSTPDARMALLDSQEDGFKLQHADTTNMITKKIKSLDQGDDSSSSPTFTTDTLLVTANLTDDPPASPKGHHRSQSDGTVLSQYDDFHDGRRETDKKSVKNILSQLLPSTPVFTPIQLPFNQQEHYTLPTGVYFPIVVYENEPSSIVAYALNTFDYKKSLDDLHSKRTASNEQTPSPIHKRYCQMDKDKLESGEIISGEKPSLLSFLRTKDRNELHSSNNSSEISQNTELNVDKVDDVKNSKMLHVEVQFEDSNCNFFCRIYYAEKFASLRSTVLSVGEEAYIRSLSRSIQWNARGGKSGSAFCKTMDDRFVLKDVPKSEVQIFLDFAPNYFSYMHRCYTSAQPTLLGKIVGIYQIVFRNNTSSATLRANLLVMENLFYNRTVSQKFDLKGSMRNRLVNPDNEDGEIVLLDENLVKMSCESPLYILPHSKAVLMAAIQNDTEFLSTQSVMDYSLLVGKDNQNKELVLGIIDYIRTFTWDKKCETWVKKTGMLWGHGKLPTIISPEEYCKRFIVAMHRYFLEVPDPWAGLGRGLEC